MRLILVLAAAVAVAGCNQRDKGIAFDGWTSGPDPENGALTVSNDRLILQGKCNVL